MKNEQKFYVSEHGEGATWSPIRGNYWGKIISYSTIQSDNSKEISFSDIPKGCYINNYGKKIHS